MSIFIIRVVLHGAEESEGYAGLHAAMEKSLYYRTITAMDGVIYDLPPATYRASATNWTREMILKEVRSIANGTGYKNSILVTVSRGCAWIGLDPAVN